MELITTAILSGVAYDILKSHTVITSKALKKKISKWLIDDQKIEELVTEMNELYIRKCDKDQIKEKFDKSELINKTIRNINKQKIKISQTHSGDGDNVGGNKTIINK
ncbi:hypothetical protein [Marinicella sp. W31]|uniref:GapS6a family protein n=1 Tax=Marinicella sp. W31 TaxID=3023713 RepID=UPI003756DE40